jgi:hypothetical protein
MGFEEPSFDIFRGIPDRQAIWVERVAGLAAAGDPMEQLAAENPGSYSIFSGKSHAILARHVESPRRVPLSGGFNIFRKLNEGGSLKIVWRRDQEQARALVARLMDLWPAEYSIEPAEGGAESDTEAPAAIA